MKKAFTLIELLVVVLIIGILTAIALPQYQITSDKARYAQLMVLVKSLKDAQERYYMANGSYTRNFEELDIEMPAGGTLQEGAGFPSLRYPFGFVRILYGAGNNWYVYGRDKNAYQIHLENSDQPGVIRCLAYNGKETTQDRYNKVCLSFGGVYENSSDGCSGVGGWCHTYRLP